MAEVTYTFGDVFTGKVIEEIRLQGVSLNFKLSGSDMRGSFHLNQPGKSNDSLISATIPGRCYVVVERDDRIIGDFLITSRTYQSQAYSMEFYGKGFRSYFDMRVANYNQSYVNTDQAQIFLDLLTQCLSDPNTPNITVPSFVATNILRTIDIKATELKSFGSIISNIADGDDGFDWTVDSTRNLNVYQRKVRYRFPTIGTNDTINTQVFEYPGNITNYWETDSVGSAGTTLFATGAGEGESMLITTVTHSDLLDSDFPRYDVVTSHKDVYDIDVLTSLAVQDALRYKATMPIITAEIKDAFYADLIGNTCRLIIKDPRHQDVLTKDTRVLAAEYYPASSDSVEMTRLNFEGDDDV